MVSFAATVMNMSTCSAVQHVVGEDRGWDPSYSNFQGWASGKIFQVGDNLWFAYASAQQNVLELKSQEELEKCDLSNPTKLYNGGLDAVALVKTGNRYFSSGRVEDCRNGMKFHINHINVIYDDGKQNGSDNFNAISHGMDNYVADHDLNFAPDGMESGADNFNLLSDGMENGANNLDLVSDGMEYGHVQGFESSSLFPSAVKHPRMGRMEAAEGPAYSSASDVTLSRLAYSVSWVQIWFLVTIFYPML